MTVPSVKLHPAGALHFEQKAIQRAVQPDDFVALQGRVRAELARAQSTGPPSCRPGARARAGP